MLTEYFYTTLDQELTDLVDEYKDIEILKKIKPIEQKKSYAFLIWFLQFYGGTDILFKTYITEGNDDSSCDIIFSKSDADNKECFYIIQSKWRNQKNALKTQGINDDIKKALSDFDTILHGNRKLGNNIKFNEQYTKLTEHLLRNGEVKFVFLVLAPQDKNSTNIEDNILSFKKNHPTVREIEILDIQRLKYDFIDARYKRIQPKNPLEYQSHPENAEITLDIERISNATEQGDYIRVAAPFEAYIFFIKPKTLFELFQRHGFNLFAQNIRNPLPESNYNQQVVETLTTKPSSFWYFNNGISAITRIIPKGISRTATQIEITGLQIINGAQTVYSVYQAYKDADRVTRQEIDDAALISIRLIKTNDVDFNRQITLYTNSQNPIFERDFHANDDIQIRLQQASFQTSIWYEKRRGEFDKNHLPEGIETVSNEIFAYCYLTYHLQVPLLTISVKNRDQNLLFTTRKVHPDGLYEKIFNDDTKFIDMLAGFYLYRTLTSSTLIPDNTSSPYEEDKKRTIYLYLAIFKTVAQKYAQKKKMNEMQNISNWIIKNGESENRLIKKIIIFIHDFFLSFRTQEVRQLFTSPNYFERLKLKIEDDDVSLERIDTAELSRFFNPVEERDCKQISKLYHDSFVTLPANESHPDDNDESTVKHLEVLETIPPDDDKEFGVRGLILTNLGRYDEAIACFDDVLQANPTDVSTWNNRGLALSALNRNEEAIASYKQALSINPDLDQAWYNCGNSFRALSQYEEAITCYDKAFQIKPDKYNAVSNRAVALYDLGRYEEALAATEIALKIKPDDGLIWNTRGLVLFHLCRYEEAINAYNKALEIIPDTHYVWFNLSRVFGKLDRHEEAVTAYSQVLEFNPADAGTWNNRGFALAQLNRYEEALSDYEQALELDPALQITWKNYSAAFYQLGRYQEALDACKQLLQLNPDDAEAWNNQGLTLYQLGLNEEANEAFDKAAALRLAD